MAINPRKIKRKPMAARDLKQSNPRDLRNKALREANKMASEKKASTTKPRPAADLKQSNPKDLRNKALREANKMASSNNPKKKTVAKAPNRALVATGNSRAVVPYKGKVPAVSSSGGSRSVAVRPNTAVTVAKETAKTTAKVGLRGLLGAGSAVVGMVTESRPLNTGEAEFLARQKAITRVRKEASNLPARPPSKSTGTGRPETPGGYTPMRPNRKYDTAIGPKKPIMPSVSMAGGGVNKPTAKKKAGATTSAAPAVSKPKRRTNLERMRRRQAERFSIGSSGKSL